MKNSEENRHNPSDMDSRSFPKRSFWLRLVFLFGLAAAAAVLIIFYKDRQHPSPFEKGIIRSLSFANFPFVEKSSFFFPAPADDQKTPEESEEKTVLEEASSMKKSKSADWWLNSGGVMFSGAEEFSTNLGPLSEDSSWRKLYNKTNSRDTDKGYYPQNIFRLVTRDKWKDFSQSVYFNIEKINMSKSEYRNESNGVLLFNRYQDGDNLYYIGIRVDGDAVIKKKIAGKYYTLAEKEIFSAGSAYDKDNNPDLIPENVWIGIRSEVQNAQDGSVGLKFYVDEKQDGNWQLVLETKDKGDKHGDATFSSKGYAGIRTDFMDVKFKNYTALKL